ncbi:class I SAM-dependent methyltransferase [Aspergillus undulatus]|uniref:class I SAM-dependent methyltransferase n=1 Tax=Aspergillus undulatus TaxID=1810928 RepID=UPI003CCE501F
MIKPQDKYVLGRHKKESERLNLQHNLLSKITSNFLIHPSIPTGDIISVADVATGTGVWLDEVSQVLDNNKNSQQHYYHGFDISSAQFPEELPMTDLHFSVQDITSPFPQEHLNKYDLVHVRLLIAALEESEYKTALTNISAILKPGGYLQWEEIDEETYMHSNNPVIREMRRCFDISLRVEGKCFAASAKVYEECKATGFLDAERLEYSSESISESGLRSDKDEWFAALIETLYARLLMRSREVPDQDAAAKRAAELIEQHWALCKEGMSSPLKAMRVVARKA